MSLSSELTLLAPAKLNLFLHITGRREDGYHELQTFFQLLDYGDTLHFKLRRETSEVTLSDHFNVPPTENLILRAAQLLQLHANVQIGADITIKKQIPMGAGLGGGSSDAAATLKALNHLWNTGLTLNELSELGKKLGADVPVFVHGYSAWAEGIGDRLTPLALPEKWYVVITPSCHVSTQEMFKQPDLPRHTPKITPHDFLSGNSHNDFEPVVMGRYSEIKETYDWLMQFGFARLTGSGCSIFIDFHHADDALKVFHQIPKECQGFMARGINSLIQTF